MKKLIVVALAAASLGGCGAMEIQAQAEREGREALRDRPQLKSDLNTAMQNANITCDNTQSCEKAFRLAKIYVQENADMKIQLSDDTMVSTYNPTKYGYVGLRATKVPGAGASATINLTASCYGMDIATVSSESPQLALLFTRCARRVIPVYQGFRPYIEPKLP